MIKYGRLMPSIRLGCFAHGAHLVVCDVLYSKKRQKTVSASVYTTVSEYSNKLNVNEIDDEDNDTDDLISDLVIESGIEGKEEGEEEGRLRDN